MIPLMMSQDFKPKGWLGLILGTRMWCKSFDVQVALRAWHILRWTLTAL